MLVSQSIIHLIVRRENLPLFRIVFVATTSPPGLQCTERGREIYLRKDCPLLLPLLDCTAGERGIDFEKFLVIYSDPDFGANVAEDYAIVFGEAPP